MRFIHFILPAFAILLFACRSGNGDSQGSGVFEAREVIVSANIGGQVIALNVEEGTAVSQDQVVGEIDCEDIVLQKAQVAATQKALSLKQVEAAPEVLVIEKQITAQQSQIRALEAQYAVLEKDRKRLETLVAAESAPQKQLDDITGELDVLTERITAAKAQEDVLQQQIRSARSTAGIRNRSILSEDEPLEAQLARLENQLDNCRIINPVQGTVIAKYIERFEMVGAGKPLYKVADLDTMTLRAYLSGDQLTAVKLGQAVRVLVDDETDDYRTYDGTISWIADKAEFTPKTIMTRDERAHLVYAIKVAVPNDGLLRIGMYGELDF
jgi:HlyD family secretion protein